MFASDSIWNWKAEENFKRLKEENPDLVRAAKAGHAVVDPETGLVSSRRASRATAGEAGMKDASGGAQAQAVEDGSSPSSKASHL